MIIKLPCYGIDIETFDNPCHPGLAGTITSDLKGDNTVARTKVDDNPQLTAAMDAIESLVLAHACAGVDITTPAYIEGIETAVEACWNRLD